MDERIEKMKAAFEARVKSEPGNANAWRENARRKHDGN